MELVDLRPANDNVHKYTALFQTENGLKQVRFGAIGYDDFTITNDLKQKKAYLARHRAREYWDDPMTPGALSRWLLWNKPTLHASILDFKKRFSI